MKTTMMILNEKEIRQCVDVNQEAFDEVAKGFSALAENKVTLPPIMRIEVKDHDGEVDVKTAYIHGLDSFAIKIAAGFYANYLKGLPSSSGMMVLVRAETGFPMALLLDNGYLTDVRTGIAGAIAAEYLAPKEIKVAGVIGSGIQSRYQIRGLRLVRPFSKLMVFGIVEQEVDRYLREMTDELGIEVVKAKDVESVVRESQFVVTTTPSKEPFLRAEYLHPGLHITCMGADAEDKQELHAEVFLKADRIACDVKTQVFRLGELHHALMAGFVKEDDVIELGELTTGRKKGRESAEEITVCDLTGVGVQDTQIARLAYRRALEQGLGTAISGD